MSEINEGVIIILSSPSGAGKTTLVKKISLNNNFSISISHTTRKPRSKEINGKDYFFVSGDEFKELIRNKKFLEYAKVFNNYYGSAREIVINLLKNGDNVVFDIDWQGTQQIKEKKLNYKIFTIFILPPSKEELYQRLMNREINNNKIVEERMKQFKEDVLHWVEYDFVVINDELESCFSQIMNFIKQKKQNKDIEFYNKKIIKEHIKILLS